MRMETAAVEPALGTSVSSLPPATENDTGVITKLILEIIGRLLAAEDRISDVEDATNFYNTQLLELQDLVRVLQDQADDVNYRQHRNNLRAVGLSEGVEGMKLTISTEQVFKAV